MPKARDPEDYTLNFDELSKRFDTITTRLTDKLRALSLGVLAFCWALLTAERGIQLQLGHTHYRGILLTAMLAIASLLFDLLHSLGNYVQYSNLLKKEKSDGTTKLLFDHSSILFKEQLLMFWLKVLTSIAACCSLLVLIWKSLPPNP